MKKEVIFLVTLSLLGTRVMTDASSPSITVQSGPVEVKQGNDVTLWCQVEPDNKRLAPVIWHSPPDLRTRIVNCLSFLREKYGISCGESSRWYNMTIKDVQWADRGKYQCFYIQHAGIVDLKVLVPVRDVSLTSTSKPLVSSKGVDAVLTCSTDCAYPAPKISWFENYQPFKDSATVTTTVTATESGCSGEKQGQKRTIGIISVRGKRERKESIMSCVAGNVFGEKWISKAIVVTYGGPCKNMQCPAGRVCEVTSNKQSVCVCGPPDLCNGHHKQVCGNDGNMYPSHCELHRMACIKDKHIDVDHTNDTCKPVTTSPPQLTIGDTEESPLVGVVPTVLVLAVFICSFTVALIYHAIRK